MKFKTINVKQIFNLDIEGPKDGVFKLVFWANTSDPDTYVKYALHFHIWWIRPIAEALWKVINQEKSNLCEIEVSMHNSHV